MFDRVVVVGDVHGDADRVERMLARVGQFGRPVVFVGDYIDRGPASSSVIRLLVEAKEAMGPNLVLLAGNHETELIRYLDAGDFVRYASVGGMATIRSYVGEAKGDVQQQLKRAIPAAHERLIREELRTYVETGDFLISHAGFNPDAPLRRDAGAMTESSHPGMFLETTVDAGPKLVVCGHYVQRTLQPFSKARLICLDTGCGTLGGPLTAVTIPEREFFTT